MSDRIIKIEKNIESLHKMTFDKLEKHDKSSENVMHFISNTNK